MSVQVFITISIIIWFTLIVILLVVAVFKAQSPLLQEISRILSISPASPESATMAAGSTSPSAQGTQSGLPAGASRMASPSSQHISYQRKLSVLGAYLDRQQRIFTAIWELNDGYLLQTVRSGSSQVDYLKVSDLQLSSLARSPLAVADEPGFSSTLLGGIGGTFDQRRATTVQLAVVGRNVVTGGLELAPPPASKVMYQSQAIYRPFQEVFAMPSSTEPEP